MIVYFDTSALVKLFVLEDGSDLVEGLRSEADAIATSCIAYVEACAALTRRYREKRLSHRNYLDARRGLLDQWPDFAIAQVNEVQAGELAAKYKLRGLDAIHIEAANEVRKHTKSSPTFCTFDERQAEAAIAERFNVVPGLH